MNIVFVDAAYSIAILNPRDQYAQAATHLAYSYSGRMVTTTFVLTEVCNLLSSSNHRMNASTLVEELEEAEDTEVIHPDWSLWKRSHHLYSARPDKAWSLTDCLSFIVMQDRGLTEAMTADRHFEQAGFSILLK